MQDPQPQKSFFPKIFRFITEKGVLLTISLVSLVVLAAIVLQAIKLQETLNKAEIAKTERMKLEKELAYWQGVTRQYGNYRDAYFKIATIHYQLGEITQAKKSLEKVLSLDPNFESARVLGDKIASH